jgi:hypothetical protein
VLVPYAACKADSHTAPPCVTGEARRGDTLRDETAWSPEAHDFKASDYTKVRTTVARCRVTLDDAGTVRPGCFGNSVRRFSARPTGYPNHLR